MEKIRIGIVGNGSISSSHMTAYQQCPDVEVIALCDIKPGRAQEKKEKFGFTTATCYEDYHEFLANPDIDAISICVWNNQHAEIAIAALKAGKHVLCEKPPAISAELAKEMKQTALDNNKLLMIGFVRRFGSDVETAKDFIDQGFLGNIYYAKTSCIRRRGNPGGWFADKSRSGGGPLLDLGVHMIDLVRYLMGKPNPVTVTGSTFTNIGMDAGVKGFDWYKSADFTPDGKCDVEDMATAYIRFDGGQVLNVETSFSQNIEKEVLRLELYGDKGGMIIYPELKIYTKMGGYLADVTPVINMPAEFQDMFNKEIRHFVDCVKNGETVCRNTPDDGVAIMQILDAVYASAEQQREIVIQ